VTGLALARMLAPLFAGCVGPSLVVAHRCSQSISGRRLPERHAGTSGNERTPGGRARAAHWARSRPGLVGGFIGACFALLLPWPGPALAPVTVLVGSRVPRVVDERAARRRRRAVEDGIPQLLDLLAASSSGGLSAQLALHRSVEALGGPLAEELGSTLREVELGERWRDALGSAADRIGSHDLRRAVSTLVRSETLGTSLAEATRELAATVRETRRLATTERARTAPVKMLFPLVFLVLPAFLLLTVVPVLLTTLESIR
jgi:pilus assembly protein TadC